MSEIQNVSSIRHLFPNSEILSDKPESLSIYRNDTIRPWDHSIVPPFSPRNWRGVVATHESRLLFYSYIVSKYILVLGFPYAKP